MRRHSRGLRQRPSGNCPKCGSWRQSLHRDHILPKYKGGSDAEDNVQYICANCHEDKSRLDLQGKPGNRVGKKNSAEHRRKQREGMLAAWRRPETRARLVTGLLAAWKEPEVRARIVYGMKGSHGSRSTRAN